MFSHNRYLEAILPLLAGKTFRLFTDHAPLQWLADQKMEGLLAHWALPT